MSLSVRELQYSDIERITNYWLTSPDDYLIHMGVALNKMPPREEWIAMLTEQLNTAIPQKKIVLHHLAGRRGTYWSLQYQ